MEFYFQKENPNSKQTHTFPVKIAYICDFSNTLDFCLQFSVINLIPSKKQETLFKYFLFGVRIPSNKANLKLQCYTRMDSALC